MNRAVQQASPHSTLKKPLNLALQGGGSHGAYTWGVLDALLEDGRIEIEAISGTSAGAMNAAALAAGWASHPQDPHTGAREKLATFWQSISDGPGFGSWNAATGSDYSMEGNPFFMGFDLLSRIASPYQLNPLNLNPLRDVVEAQIDFEKIKQVCPFHLYLCATNVRTGHAKVFTGEELSADAVMASACLPFVFQAVEIKGQAYWDGGFMGNPSLFPLYATNAPDILLVAINPLERAQVPDTAAEIIDRVNEISFNSSLMLEMRAIEFVQRMLEEGQIQEASPKNRTPRFVQRLFRRKSAQEAHYKRIYMHMIDGGQDLLEFGASSKFNTSWEFLSKLHDLGYHAAKQWLRYHWRSVGEKSSLDIAKVFL
ncbi:patatin-like phospholipase family protein [Parvibium lacunae]|uniref:Patatin-like phospholipase family protein n=1 Tax=Parvibium lacunae TaxID=1888893 RepID=A0A368L3Q7_9BURK|nr:patatin-like phospholipase family protein [Parvibium lacunae]RCS58052.1 patatin-like phospholipase family protein [Parvibium lacunae]